MSAEDTFATLYRIAQHAARRATTPYADQGDLVQEGMLWLLEHPKRVEHATLPDGTLYRRQLVSEVIDRALAPFVARERDAVFGRDESDTYVYSKKVVELALPAVFDPNYRPAFLESGDKVSTNADPRNADNWTVFVADVSNAVDAVCSREDRKVMFTRSIDEWTWERFGQELTLSGESYRVRYQDALSRIVQFLNAGIVVEDSDDGELLDDAINGPPDTTRAEFHVEWETAGRDPYVEPDA